MHILSCHGCHSHKIEAAELKKCFYKKKSTKDTNWGTCSMI